jgi:enoyl-CoA hydratase/carnithine racemase
MSEHATQDRGKVVLYDVQDHVALVTLHRPERLNAWTQGIADGLSDALEEAQADDTVRAIVITGAGRAFCAGADLQGGGDTFAGRTDDGSRPPESDPGSTRRNVYPYQIHKPVIAAIQGAAVGVGLTYPMLCDQRIVAESAKLGFVFTRRGMIPELAAHLIVARVAGFSNAADLLMSGRIFTGAEAVRLGLASEALPSDQVLDRALSRAGEYVLTAPTSVAITKRLLWECLDSDVAGTMQREGPLFAWAGNQPDAREGIASFVEKRPPRWTGSVARNLPEAL